jgi:L-alanine-DL-glutamate epimerase-like enolase superfamily enzyme
MSMKITKLEAIPVEVPLKAGMSTKTAHGEHVTSAYVILKVHTDEGLIGLGEATVAPRWSGGDESWVRRNRRRVV